MVGKSKFDLSGEQHMVTWTKSWELRVMVVCLSQGEVEVVKILVEIKVLIQQWCSKSGELYLKGFIYPMTRARLKKERGEMNWGAVE